MASVQPRVQAPGNVAKGQVFQIRTLIAHPMETGLRIDESGHVVPRKLINTLICRYNDQEVFRADLHEAVAANPYLAFYVRANESGQLEFIWQEDGGATFTLQKPITVSG
jgi:sulfur-oxidizing protein SoxZ